MTNQWVDSTIRLWTKDRRTDKGFEASYHVNAGPHKAIWYSQWLYRMDVGVLDLASVCQLMQESKTKPIRLGEIKKKLRRMGSVQ